MIASISNARTSAGASSHVEGAPTKGNAQSLANEKFRSTSTNDDGDLDITACGAFVSLSCGPPLTLTNGLSEEQEIMRYRPRAPGEFPARGVRRGSQKPTTSTTPGQTSQPTGTQEQTSQPSEERLPPSSSQTSAVKKLKGPQTTQTAQGQIPQPTHEQASQPTKGSTPQSTEGQKSSTPQQPSAPKKKNSRVAAVTATSQTTGRPRG